jgi:hypothetical protein
MNALTRFMFSSDADPLVWTLGPVLVLAQIAVFAVAWHRVHHGDHVTQTEILADLAPMAVLAGLFLVHPYMVEHPDSPMPLVVAYAFLAAIYATVAYGSLAGVSWGRRGSRTGGRRVH